MQHLSTEELDDLVAAARKEKRSRRTPEQAEARAEKLATVKKRAKANKPKPLNRKARRKGSISMKPATEPDKVLQQVSRDFGSQWINDATNPAVSVVALESQLCARLNVYSAGRWTARRLGDDIVTVVVKLQDGTEETRRFTRSVLSADWKRC